MIFRRIWRSSLADRELQGMEGVTCEKDAVLSAYYLKAGGLAPAVLMLSQRAPWPKSVL